MFLCDVTENSSGFEVKQNTWLLILRLRIKFRRNFIRRTCPYGEPFAFCIIKRGNLATRNENFFQSQTCTIWLSYYTSTCNLKRLPRKTQLPVPFADRPSTLINFVYVHFNTCGIIFGRTLLISSLITFFIYNTTCPGKKSSNKKTVIFIFRHDFSGSRTEFN